MRPHVKDHPVALKAFRNQIELGGGPRNAAMAAMTAGAYVPRDWLLAHYCPVHANVAALEKSGDLRSAIAHRTDHLSEHQQEIAALQYVELMRSWAETTSTDDDDRRVAEEREAARLKERLAFISVRAVSLFEQWLEAKREEFRLEAAAEFDAMRPPIVANAPAPTTPPVAPVASIAPKKPANSGRKSPTETPPSAA